MVNAVIPTFLALSYLPRQHPHLFLSVCHYPHLLNVSCRLSTPPPVSPSTALPSPFPDAVVAVTPGEDVGVVADGISGSSGL